jgi:hypothetical protein
MTDEGQRRAKRSGTGWRAPRSGGYSARPGGEKSPPPSGPGAASDPAPPAELPELQSLPAEVVALVHAVDRMRDKWAEGDDAVKQDLWRRVHEACNAVWGRGDSTPAGPDTALRERLAALAYEYADAAYWREHPEQGDDPSERVVARTLRTVETDLRRALGGCAKPVDGEVCVLASHDGSYPCYGASDVGRDLSAAPPERDTAPREREIRAAARELQAWNVKGREQHPRFVLHDTGEEDGYEAVAEVVLATAHEQQAEVLSAAPPEHHSHCASLHPGEVEGDPCDCRTLRMIDRHKDQEASTRELARSINAAIWGSREQDCPRPFGLYRHEDVTGASGTGLVATGVCFSDGQVVIRWRGDTPSTVVWPSIEAAEKVHGHGGKTQIVWLAEPIAELCAAIEQDMLEREASTPASVRAAALRRIEQREATPGNPADGPYPASVGEVADELAGLVVELDAGPAQGLVRELVARLAEREAPSREEVINVVWRGLSDDLRRAQSGGVDVDMRPATVVDALIVRGWLQVREEASGEACDGE